MDKQELRYLLDYAKRHHMMHSLFITVFNMWNKEIEEAYK